MDGGIIKLHDYKLVIPTRNSGRWLNLFVQAYRKLGIEPLYVVDGRSDDDTLLILRSANADYLIYTPEKDFAEDGMVEYGARAAGTEWVLRLDDDEFPNQALLDWLQNIAVFGKGNCWAISRRDVGCVSGEFLYSRWPTRIRLNGVHNPQERLFRVNFVTYVNEVHTPGFVPDNTLSFAPNDCFFIHVNNIVRDIHDRLAKVRTYARYNPVKSWECSDECLWELTDYKMHAFCREGLSEFADLLAGLPRKISSELPLMTESEKLLMENSLHNSMQIHKAHHKAWMEIQKADRTLINMIPATAVKKIGELLFTISGLLAHNGAIFFKNYDLRVRYSKHYSKENQSRSEGEA